MDTRNRKSTRKNSERQTKERIIPIKIEDNDEECNVTSTTPEEALSESPSKVTATDTEEKQSLEMCSSDDEGLNDLNPNHNGIKVEKESDEAIVPCVPVAVPERTLPSFNILEKIIIVLDSALDEVSTSFEMTNGKKHSPLDMLRRSLEIFLHNKSFINKNHQYALVVLGGNAAYWMHDFTNSIKNIISTMALVTECEPEDIFNLNSLFDLIESNVLLTPSEDNLHLPPLVIYRMILTYGRSYSIPQLEQTPSVTELLRSPYFTVDVVMTHENADTANHCERIFKTLQEIDPKGSGYAFSVARNSCDLHNAMAKVLSHPLQRPRQADADYKINKD